MKQSGGEMQRTWWVPFFEENTKPLLAGLRLGLGVPGSRIKMDDEVEFEAAWNFLGLHEAYHL